MLISDNVIIQASESEYDGLEFSVKDQLIVDDRVRIEFGHVTLYEGAKQ